MTQDEKGLNDFISPAGFVAHKKYFGDKVWWDCGDASQRQFMAIYFWSSLRLINFNFLTNLWHESYAATFKDNNPIRHPPLHQLPMGEETEWWAETKNYTLDQMRPLICSAIVLEQYKALRMLFKLMKARHGFAWNFRRIGQKKEDKSEKIPDVMGSMEWTLFRAYLAKAWPDELNWYDLLRLRTDTVLLKAKAEFRVLWSRLKPDDSGDDINFMLMTRTLARLNYCPEVYRSYMTRRAICHEVEPKYKVNGVVSAFRNYFWNDKEHPPFHGYALSLYEQDLDFLTGLATVEQWLKSTT